MAEADCHDCRALLSKNTNTSSSDFLPESGRYTLYLQYGCPFAQRANIVLQLKGLENIVDLVVLDPTKTLEGFQFTGKFGTAGKDPYYGFSHIRQLYWKVDPDRKGPFTIPLLWDRKRECIVNNESGDIMRMLEECFDRLIPEERREMSRPGGGLYPKPLRERIDEMNAWVETNINRAVYDVAAAKDQVEYDGRISSLFSALDRVEDILARSPFLLGDSMVETDIRLFTSAVRFDAVYYGTMHCSKKMVRYNYPKLHAWMQRLYWDESELTRGAFKKTTNFEHVSFLRER